MAEVRPLTNAAPGQGALARLRENVSRVIKGKDEAIDLCAVALVAGGHVLLEDIPGVGKTTLARALAKSVGASFRRIQFTADLLPSDLLGVSVWNEQRREFEFHPGPVFHEILLADELNRASPKTQSALLEAMNEGQVSLDGATHRLPEVFLVLATQNPHEHAGTFPLPESQLDRFLLSIDLGYPSPEAEREMLLTLRGRGDVDELSAVVPAAELRSLQREAEMVKVDPSLADYIQRLCQRTREHPALSLGVSPRGAIALRRAAQARAILEGRSYLIPDDVKGLAPAVFSHRVQLRERLSSARKAAREIVEAIVRETAVPR
ncbi:MAG: MoxR family ATPase [Bdellovibrionota bacterium]